MNLRKTIISLIAGACLISPLAAPVANAQLTDDADAEVTLAESGDFNVYFSSNTFVLIPDASATSSSGGVAWGHLGIIYEDTISFREGFYVSVSASNFVHEDIAGVSIPAANFRPVFVYNPHQGQWGWTNPNANPGDAHSHSGNVPGAYSIGDIGGLRGGGTYYVGNQVTGHPGSTWLFPTANFSTNPYVGYAYDGVGTARGGTQLQPVATNPIPHASSPAVTTNGGTLTPASVTTGVVDGTYAGMDVQLVIPAGAPAGTYTSELTLTLTWGEP